MHTNYYAANKSDDYGQKITSQLLLAFRMTAMLSALIV